MRKAAFGTPLRGIGDAVSLPPTLMVPLGFSLRETGQDVVPFAEPASSPGRIKRLWRGTSLSAPRYFSWPPFNEFHCQAASAAGGEAWDETERGRKRVTLVTTHPAASLRGCVWAKF